MKGVIFNAVEAAVTTLYSAAAWDDLLEAAGLDGSYTSLGLYDDEELGRIVAAAMQVTGLDQAELLRVLGRHALPHLWSHYPDLMADAPSMFDCLLGVNSVIHPEVLKLHSDAKPPQFDFNQLSNRVLRVTYRSERGLGPLAQGLILGLADKFGEEIVITDVAGSGSETVFDVERVGGSVGD